MAAGYPLSTARPGAAAAFVHGLGAQAVVDYTSGDLAAAVRAVAPRGVTAVVHAAGDAAALAALLPPGGRLASALGATGELTGRGDVIVTPVRATAAPETVSALLDAAASGALRVPVARTYPLDRAAQALADFREHNSASSSSPPAEPVPRAGTTTPAERARTPGGPPRRLQPARPEPARPAGRAARR